MAVTGGDEHLAGPDRLAVGRLANDSAASLSSRWANMAVKTDLHTIHPAGPPLDPQVRISTLILGRREDLRVDIAGYGTGQLSVVLL